MKKNVSLGITPMRHSSRYAMNAIKKCIARKKSRSITDNTESILYKLECTIRFITLLPSKSQQA